MHQTCSYAPIQVIVTITEDHHARAKTCGRYFGKKLNDWLRDAVLLKIEVDEAKIREEAARKAAAEMPKRKRGIRPLPELPAIPAIQPIVEGVAAAVRPEVPPESPKKSLDDYLDALGLRLKKVVHPNGSANPPPEAATPTPAPQTPQTDLSHLATYAAGGADKAEVEERLRLVRVILVESSETAEEALEKLHEIEHAVRGDGK